MTRMPLTWSDSNASDSDDAMHARRPAAGADAGCRPAAEAATPRRKPGLR